MKKIYSILIILLLGSVLFVGCSKKNAGLENNPSTNATVISNGGNVIRKENYFYFTNGFVSASSLTNSKKDNVFGNVTEGAIYRVLANGNDFSATTNGQIQGAELVVPKVVSFENGGFYIFGDYIYYTTPNMKSDGSGNLKNNTVDFCKINISGAKKTNTILAEAVDVGEGEWRAYSLNGEVYFVVYANSTLTSMKMGKKKGEVIEMATGVESASLPNYEIYSPTNQENDTNYADMNGIKNYDSYIFFTTKDSESTKKGNKLCKVQIGTNNVSVVEETNYTYSITSQKDGYLFYTKNNGVIENSPALLYRSDITNGFNNEKKLTNVQYSSVYALNTVAGETTVISYENKILKAVKNGGAALEILLDKEIQILNTKGNYIYYREGSTVYRINVMDKTIQSLYVESESDLIYSNEFEVLGNRVFVNVKYGESYYVACVNTASSLNKIIKVKA